MIDISSITINKHSSIRIASDRIIYIDPFKIDAAYADAEVVFITHDHYDHFSPEDIAKVCNSRTVFVAPATCAASLKKAGITNAVLMNPEDVETICGLKVTAVPAYNRFKPFHMKASRWLGYVIEVENTEIYVCGDTDDTPDARKVKCDILLVPVGGTYTMSAKEAAAFANALNPQVAIPTHYGDVVGKHEDAETFASLADCKVEIRMDK